MGTTKYIIDLYTGVISTLEEFYARAYPPLSKFESYDRDLLQRMQQDIRATRVEDARRAYEQALKESS